VHVFLDYITGNMTGQTIINVVTASIVQFILKTSPVLIQESDIEGGAASDLKASIKNLIDVRGRRVVAEAIIPNDIVQQTFKTTPERMAAHRFKKHYSHIQLGNIGTSAHFANALTALFIACGQDPACVTEGHGGISRFEVTKSGDLYVCATLPNLLVGTEGGATGLPSQSACLNIIGINGKKDSAKILAEIAAVAVIGGELSLVGSFTSGDFAVAHYALSRGVSAHRDTYAKQLLLSAKM